MWTVSVNTRKSFKITYLWLAPGLLTFLVFSKHLAWVITMANGKKCGLLLKEILETPIPLFIARPIHARAVNRLFAGTS